MSVEAWSQQAIGEEPKVGRSWFQRALSPRCEGVVDQWEKECHDVAKNARVVTDCRSGAQPVRVDRAIRFGYQSRSAIF